jgi:hypothetical protein
VPGEFLDLAPILPRTINGEPIAQRQGQMVKDFSGLNEMVLWWPRLIRSTSALAAGPN